MTRRAIPSLSLAIAQQAMYTDGFKSVTTGLGTAIDKARTYSFEVELRIPHQQLDLLYALSEFCYKVIDPLPEDGLSKWIDINHEKAPEINAALAKLNSSTIFPGLKWLVNYQQKMSRLHGGAAILWDIDDGLPLDQPVNLTRIKAFNGGTVHHAGYCWPINVMEGISAQLWWIYHYNGATPVMVHVSRLSIDHSQSASGEDLMRNNSWPRPIMERVYEFMKSLTTSYMKIPTILEDFITKTYSMFGLNDMLLSTDDTALQQKVTSQFDATSVCNAWVQDSQDTYQKMSTTMTGIPESIAVLERAFAAVCDIPYGKIFGEYGGNALSSSSASQDNDWNKTICSYQNDHLKPTIARAIEIQSALMGITEPIPFAFPPQHQPTAQEDAQLHLTQAQADAIQIDKGILYAEEIAASRYGGDEYSTQTQLDPALRAKKEAEKVEMQAQAALMPPAPAPMPPEPKETENDD